MARRPWERGGWPCRFAFCVVLSDPVNNPGLDNVYLCDFG